MIEWFAIQPWVTGAVTFFLMWTDWLPTISQERERQLHYSEHYESYPINTIEGNPLYQKAVLERRIIDPRHIVPAAILSVVVALSLVWIPEGFRVLLIGYVLCDPDGPLCGSGYIPDRAGDMLGLHVHAGRCDCGSIFSSPTVGGDAKDACDRPLRSGSHTHMTE